MLNVERFTQNREVYEWNGDCLYRLDGFDVTDRASEILAGIDPVKRAKILLRIEKQRNAEVDRARIEAEEAARATALSLIERARERARTGICPRCDGSGNLPQFSHVCNGICFLCGGRGRAWYAAQRDLRDLYNLYGHLLKTDSTGLGNRPSGSQSGCALMLLSAASAGLFCLLMVLISV